MIHPAPISSRNQLGRWLACRGLSGCGVELGTHRGEFARVLLSTWPGILHCVDPWSVPPGYEAQAAFLRRDVQGASGEAQEARDEDFRAARHALADFGSRAQFWRKASAEAAPYFRPGSLDFVYVDADHSQEAVADDLRLWWPRLRAGGVLAGHDFMCPGPIDAPDNWGREIQPAVLGFARRHGVDVLLIMEEEGLPHSYVLERPS